MVFQEALGARVKRCSAVSCGVSEQLTQKHRDCHRSKCLANKYPVSLYPVNIRQNHTDGFQPCRRNRVLWLLHETSGRVLIRREHGQMQLCGSALRILVRIAAVRQRMTVKANAAYSRMSRVYKRAKVARLHEKSVLKCTIRSKRQLPAGSVQDSAWLG